MKKLRTGTKNALNRMLAPFNLEVRKRRSPHVPPMAIADPLEAVSRINSGERAAIDCDITHCVIFNGLSFGPDAWHPFVAALDEFAATPGRAYAGSILERYYQAWQPGNGLECLVGAATGPAALAAFPAYLMHSPWIEASPEERLRFTVGIAEMENGIFGAAGMGIDHGYGLQGPVSQAKGELEYRRLLDVTSSIRADGYDRSRGDITAQVLQRGDEFRFRILHGQHRLAALAHLGYTQVPVAPVMLVRAEESAHWPQVHRGVWSEAEALAYFHHHFEFDSLAWARRLGLAPPV